MIGIGDCPPRGGPTEDLAAERLAAAEVAARLWAGVVDGAEKGRGIESDAGAVAALVHATHAVVLRDECLRHVVARPQLDH